MKENGPTRQLSPPSMKQFREFVQKIISVPKKEIEQREAEYQRQRNQKKKRHNPHR